MKGDEQQVSSRPYQYRRLSILGICFQCTSTVRLSTGTNYEAFQEDYSRYNGFWQRRTCGISCFFLMEEAFKMSQSIPPVIIGFISGGLSYIIANYYLSKRSLQGNIRHRKKSYGTEADWGGKISPVQPY